MYRSGRDRNLLFVKQDLRNYIDPISQEMLSEIADYDKNSLLNTSSDDLAKYFADKYFLEFINIIEDEISAEEQETKIDMSNNFDYLYDGIGPRPLVDATKITVRVPFTGQREILYCNPNQAYMAPPVEGEIEGNLVVFSVIGQHPDPAQFKPEIDNRIKQIKDRLEMMRDDVNNYNNGLLAQATNSINARKEKLKSNNSLVASLGYKLHKRDGTPKTYSVPEVRRKLKPPTPSTEPATQLDPSLDDTEFDHILDVVSNMVLVMERSPKTFENLDEENIRDHFLVQLNGQYEGQATGETFNNVGKTDILIRQDGKNIFVAECKFWRGAEQFLEGLNQLLSYSTWRDGKLALLVFNRNKNFSEVIKQVSQLVESNENFIKTLEQKSESEFQFKMSHPSDKEKHLTLAVLLFDVPSDH